MILKKCNNGHYYDGDKSDKCPYCSSNGIQDGMINLKGDNNVKFLKYKKVSYNIFKWLTQTVALSILPLAFYVLIHWMFQIQTDLVEGFIKEICAFTLVISSSVTIELSKQKYRASPIKEIVVAAQLLCLIIFLMLYGVIICCIELNISLTDGVINNIFLIVICISIIHFIIAFLLQILGGIYDE